jgi:uncharacterized protein (TIGR02594 family)
MSTMFTPVDFSPYPWMRFALEEYGVQEIAGQHDNRRIIEFLATCSPGSTHDETAWCSAFVNWCMLQAGIQGTGRGTARSWLTWGDQCLATPHYGAVTILWRGQPRGWQGHVGFYVGSNQGRITLLGGNQGDAVSLVDYRANRLLGYRWPPGFAVPLD